MEAIKSTPSRIHPLMAAAAVSVTVVSLAGTAAITGLLPSSHGAPETGTIASQATATYPGVIAPVAAPAAAAPLVAQPQPVAYAQPAVAVAQPAPVIIKETVIREVPVKATPKPRPVQHHTTYAQAETPAYAQPAPQPAAQQPNYLAIGTGAVVGGLLGNQVGSGNGRKLATVAGVIGGGFLGNQIAGQNR